MATESLIEWTDATWNPVVGCERVSEGCRNCYAEHAALSVVRRLGALNGMGRLKAGGVKTLQAYENVLRVSKIDGTLLPRWNGTAIFMADRIGEPLKWRQPKRVFVNSMSDLFHDDITDDQITEIFTIMAHCQQHTFQVLTKRPGRMLDWMRSAIGFSQHAAMLAGWPLPNVHIGVSVENQDAANERIPLLLQCPASVRWVSVEPLLGPVELCRVGDDEEFPGVRYNALSGVMSSAPTTYGGPVLDWVVVGGESGEGARECDVDWIRNVVYDCQTYKTPVFVKQLGGVRDKRGDIARFPVDIQVRQFPKASKVRP
jgi:protein gp37